MTFPIEPKGGMSVVSQKTLMRSFEDSDWVRFPEFAQEHFGQSHLIEREFNEHWFKNVWHGSWAIRIVEDKDRNQIVGMMAAIVVPMKFGDSTVSMAWISSGAVNDEVRARGGGAQLYFWVYQSFPLVGAMSGNEFSAPINARLGLDIPGVSMRRFVVAHRENAALLALPENQNKVRSCVKMIQDLTGDWVIRWIETIPADYDLLWQKLREHIFCAVERHRAYMSWRYERAPFVNYKFLEIRSGAVLEALAVIRIQSTPQGPVWRVVDFVANQDNARQVWRAVISAAQQEGALFTDFMVIGNLWDDALVASGFVCADENSGLAALPHLLSPVEHRQWSNTFNLGGSLARKDQSWRSTNQVYFTKGDSDRDWPTSYDLRKIKQQEPLL